MNKILPPATEDYIRCGVAEFVGSTITCPNFHHVWKQAAAKGAFANCNTVGDYATAYCQFVIDKLAGYALSNKVESETAHTMACIEKGKGFPALPTRPQWMLDYEEAASRVHACKTTVYPRGGGWYGTSENGVTTKYKYRKYELVAITTSLGG